MEATTPTGGGEEWRTRGLKLCPPRVLAMPRLEKVRRWRSGRRRVSVLRKINGLKGKIEENGGGGLNMESRKVKGLAHLMSINGC